MAIITEQTWGESTLKVWDDLRTNLWEDYRLALAESETEAVATGVNIESSNALNEILTELEMQGVAVEHSPAIARAISEMVVNIVVSNRDYYSAMLNYLPLYERDSTYFKEILKAYDKEFRGIEQSLEVVERNMFLDTAIELLYIYERDLGIKNIDSLKYDQRREQIRARKRAAFEQTTEETIKSVAVAFSNGEVEVNETTTPGLYEIKFVGTKGVPDNIEGLKEALDIVIPAHLGLEYTYTFNAWDFVSQQTWNDVSMKSWDSLRVWEGVI